MVKAIKIKSKPFCSYFKLLSENLIIKHMQKRQEFYNKPFKKGSAIF